MRKVFYFVLLSISVLVIHSCKKADPRPMPTAAFTWANAGEGIVQFTDASKEVDTYAWDFGNGMTSTEKSPKHDYGKNGKFTVTLTVKNESGENKTSQTIDVSSIPAPKTDFTVVLGTDGLATFTNASTGATTYAWDFGDATTSTEASPKKTYTENKKYSVSLTATGKGGTTKTTKDVEVVNIKPVPDFSFAEAAGTITFTNASKSADTYAWDFGDGTTSTEAAPKKTYTRNATFTVKLTATGKGGAVSVSKSVVVAGVAAPLNTKNSVILVPINLGGFTQHLAAINANTGTQLWLNTRFNSFVRGSAHVWNGLVFVGDEKAMRAISLNDGTTKWSFDAGEIHSSPLVANGIVYFGSLDKKIFYAVDAMTGIKKWEFQADAAITGAPVFKDGMIFFGTRLYFGSGKPAFYGLNATDGKVVWTHRNVDGSFDAGAVLANNELIVCDGYKNGDIGNMFVFEPATGKILRQFKIPFVSESNPTVANGLLYAMSEGDAITCIDIKTGNVLWKKPFGTTFKDQTSSPVVENDIVYVCALNSVYAYDAKSGSLKWQFNARSLGSRSPVVANGVVYVGASDGFSPSSDNSVLGIDAITGKGILNKVFAGGGLGPLVIIDQSNKAYYTGLSGVVQ